MLFFKSDASMQVTEKLSQGIKGQEKRSEWMREDVRNSSENIAFLLLIMRNTNSRWYNYITELHPSCAEGRWTNRRCHKTILKIYDSEFPLSLSLDLLHHTHIHRALCLYNLKQKILPNFDKNRFSSYFYHYYLYK